VKPNINSVEVHPQLINNGHPMDGALVGVGSLWPLIRGFLVVGKGSRPWTRCLPKAVAKDRAKFWQQHASPRPSLCIRNIQSISKAQRKNDEP
jgi:hypothetical protein